MPSSLIHKDLMSLFPYLCNQNHVYQQQEQQQQKSIDWKVSRFWIEIFPKKILMGKGLHVDVLNITNY